MTYIFLASISYLSWWIKKGNIFLFFPCLYTCITWVKHEWVTVLLYDVPRLLKGTVFQMVWLQRLRNKNFCCYACLKLRDLSRFSVYSVFVNVILNQKTWLKLKESTYPHDRHRPFPPCAHVFSFSSPYETPPSIVHFVFNHLLSIQSFSVATFSCSRVQFVFFNLLD